jgi:hypothetical protein
MTEQQAKREAQDITEQIRILMDKARKLFPDMKSDLDAKSIAGKPTKTKPIKTSQLSEAIREFDRQVIASDSFRHQLRLAQEEGRLDKLLKDVRLK